VSGGNPKSEGRRPKAWQPATSRNPKAEKAFVVSIDDGFSEWAFDLRLPGINSIGGLMAKFCRALRVECPDGRVRRAGHVPGRRVRLFLVGK
jgi:hypothetical protein